MVRSFDFRRSGLFRFHNGARLITGRREDDRWVQGIRTTLIRRHIASGTHGPAPFICCSFLCLITPVQARGMAEAQVQCAPQNILWTDLCGCYLATSPVLFARIFRATSLFAM